MRIKGKCITSAWQQALGLMFASEPRTLIFAFSSERRVCLHMWFVRFPLDVLFLDKNKRIVEKVTLRPWQFYRSNKKAAFVVELRCDTAHRAKQGDKVTFI